jgi:hypothetical protein
MTMTMQSVDTYTLSLSRSFASQHRTNECNGWAGMRMNKAAYLLSDRAFERGWAFGGVLVSTRCRHRGYSPDRWNSLGKLFCEAQCNTHTHSPSPSHSLAHKTRIWRCERGAAVALGLSARTAGMLDGSAVVVQRRSSHTHAHTHTHTHTLRPKPSMTFPSAIQTMSTT